jgi:hypothetical protein
LGDYLRKRKRQGRRKTGESLEKKGYRSTHGTSRGTRNGVELQRRGNNQVGGKNLEQQRFPPWRHRRMGR